MKLAIEDIPEEGLTLDLAGETPALEGGEGSGPPVSLAAPLKARLELRRMGSDIFINGSMEGEVLLICARCLEEFRYTVAPAIDTVVHTGHCSFPKEIELHKGDLDVSYSEAGEIDTDRLLSEQLFLGIPIQPLCSPECKGLCPSCGASIKEGPCRCRGDMAVDPRLAVLKGFKVDKKRKNN